jgi:hypothetical protein
MADLIEAVLGTASDCVYPFIVRSETSSLDRVGARLASWPSVRVRMARRTGTLLSRHSAVHKEREEK